MGYIGREWPLAMGCVERVRKSVQWHISCDEVCTVPGRGEGFHLCSLYLVDGLTPVKTFPHLLDVMRFEIFISFSR